MDLYCGKIWVDLCVVSFKPSNLWITYNKKQTKTCVTILAHTVTILSQ